MLTALTTDGGDDEYARFHFIAKHVHVCAWWLLFVHVPVSPAHVNVAKLVWIFRAVAMAMSERRPPSQRMKTVSNSQALSCLITGVPAGIDIPVKSL